MAFLRGIQLIPAALVHHTGSMLRFRPSQTKYLPTRDTDCLVILPDGKTVKGRFHLHPANPYIGGRDFVRWIKTWIEWNKPLRIYVAQVGASMQLELRMGSVTTTPNRGVGSIKRYIHRIGRIKEPRLRKKEYKRWERTPNLRRILMQVWPAECQVVGCQSAVGLSEVLKDKILDVHHIDHIARGGSDSPINLCLICASHHALIHRALSSNYRSNSSNQVTMAINGITIVIKRNIHDLWKLVS